MSIESYNRILKIAILLGFLLLLILIRVYKLDSCDKCNLEFEGRELNQEGFMNLYFDKCLKDYKVELKPIEQNFSLNIKNIKN